MENTSLACQLDRNAPTGLEASLLFSPVIDHKALFTCHLFLLKNRTTKQQPSEETLWLIWDLCSCWGQHKLALGQIRGVIKIQKGNRRGVSLYLSISFLWEMEGCWQRNTKHVSVLSSQNSRVPLVSFFFERRNVRHWTALFQHL